jgi:acetyl-CoA synthetase
MSNVLQQQGIKKGDRVCIYLPMIPELAVAVLACARIGAIHSVVFAGFSSSAVSARINDSVCKMVITADGGYRGNKSIDLLTPLPSINVKLLYITGFIFSTL